MRKNISLEHLPSLAGIHRGSSRHSGEYGVEFGKAVRRREALVLSVESLLDRGGGGRMMNVIFQCGGDQDGGVEVKVSSGSEDVIGTRGSIPIPFT